MMRRDLGVDVLSAARKRIADAMDVSEKAYVSFSGGKDSTVMLHLVMQDAIGRGRKVGVLFIDLEGQYRITIRHIERCLDLYAEQIQEFWIALPINLRNAVSAYEPHWTTWQPGREKDWIRKPPGRAIVDEATLPFFRRGMEFEDFTPAFGEWYADGQTTACFVGNRTQESLNRWRSIVSQSKARYQNWPWTTQIRPGLFNAYPIYDWRTEDIWTYHAKNPHLPANRLYDLMHRAGLTIHQQRICQPYGDDQRKGLWLFHLIEPETWGRVVARVNGANQGALYARESGNILGQQKVTLPPGHTWQSFARMLLDSMPERTAEHYKNKVAKFINWWVCRGYNSGTIPDEEDAKLEASRRVPSWRRICKALLRNDYWCKGLSFSQQRGKGSSYARYNAIMRARRGEWGIFPPARASAPSVKQIALLAALSGGNKPSDGYRAIGSVLDMRNAEGAATSDDASMAIDILKARLQ